MASSKSNNEIIPTQGHPDSQSHSVLSGLNWKLFLSIQTQTAFREWDSTSTVWHIPSGLKCKVCCWYQTSHLAVSCRCYTTRHWILRHPTSEVSQVQSLPVNASCKQPQRKRHATATQCFLLWASAVSPEGYCCWWYHGWEIRVYKDWCTTSG